MGYGLLSFIFIAVLMPQRYDNFEKVPNFFPKICATMSKNALASEELKACFYALPSAKSFEACLKERFFYIFYSNTCLNITCFNTSHSWFED